jgi:hypothetical protein
MGAETRWVLSFPEPGVQCWEQTVATSIGGRTTADGSRVRQSKARARLRGSFCSDYFS